MAAEGEPCSGRRHAPILCSGRNGFHDGCCTACCPCICHEGREYSVKTDRLFRDAGAVAEYQLERRRWE